MSDRGRLVLWSLAGLVTLALLYVVMVRLGVGQVLDDVAMEGRKATRLRPRRVASWLVWVGTPAALLVGGGLLVAGAARWRGRPSAVAVAGSLAVVVVASRILKAALGRENLLDATWVLSGNTFPSGHSAVAAALVLSAVTVAPPEWRGRVTAVAVVAIVAHTVAMMLSGWHRPSDVAGGIALAVAACGVVGLIATRWRGPAVAVDGARTPEWFDDRRGVAAAAGAALVLPLVWYVPLRLLSTASGQGSGFRSHLLLALSTCVLAALCVVVQARLTHAVDAGRAPMEPSAPSELSRREQ